jgi:hypothetical protein
MHGLSAGRVVLAVTVESGMMNTLKVAVGWGLRGWGSGRLVNDFDAVFQEGGIEVVKRGEIGFDIRECSDDLVRNQYLNTPRDRSPRFHLENLPKKVVC